jgi:hypothetical protein
MNGGSTVKMRPQKSNNGKSSNATNGWMIARHSLECNQRFLGKT